MKINGMPRTVESHRLNCKDERTIGCLILTAAVAVIVAVTAVLCAGGIFGLWLQLR